MKRRLISLGTISLLVALSLITSGAYGATKAAPASTPFVGGVFRALIIGNNDYKDPDGMWVPLKTPIYDAEAIAQVLAKSYGFSPDHIVLIKNGTRAQILSALSRIAKEAQENDSVFIYYAGHGYLDQETKEASWIPVDGVGREDHTYVGLATVKTKVAVIADRAKHVFLVSDSCFSGALLREGHRGIKPTEKNDQYYQKVAQKKSVQILAAGGLEYVDDSYKGTGHSPFTHFFLEQLEQNADRYFPATELSLDVTKAVSKNVFQTPEKGVLHGAGDNNGEFFFVNARAYASVEKPAMPSPAVASGPAGVDAEAEMWALIKESNNTEDVKSFLESFPQGRLAPVARLKLHQLERVVAHRGEQGVHNADSKAAPAPPSSGPKLAIFPGSFENDGKKAYGKSLDLIGELLLQSKMFSQIDSYYLFKDNPGIGKIPKELNPEALWKKGSIFSLPEPHPQQVCEDAKSMGVDAVLMYHVDVQRGGSRLAVYAVDVKKQKVHVAKESSIMWRLDGDHVTKVLTEKVLAEYKGEK